MPRPRGSLNNKTNSLIRALTQAEGEGLMERLAAVSEDDSKPLRMRLDACKHLAGALHGRIRLNYKAKRELGEAFHLRSPEDDEGTL
jgi:hypothetical protein